MESGGRQGWAADPFQLHEARYFSAGRPTKLVRDGTIETYDDPPSPPPNPHPTPAPRPPAAPQPTPAPRRTLPPQREPASQRADAAPQYAGPPPYAGANGRRGPGPGSARTQPGKPRAGLFVAAALVVAVAVLAAVKLVHDSGSTANPSQATPTTSPAAFVTRSAQQTLAQRTVDTSLSGTMQIAGESIAIKGTGQTNFSTDAMSFDVHANAPGGAVEETAILVNGNLYYALSLNGTNMAQLTGGRKWIQMPVQQSAAANLAGSDPVTSLSTLEQQGSTVRVLGTQVIDGVTCTGYAVTPSTQAMVAGATKLGLSPATTSQELQQIKGMSPPTVTLWIDAQGIVQQMNINLQVNVEGTGDSATMTMNFSHFGTPVTITAPAPSETISFSSFVQKLGTATVS
jgi:hypothetical protein